MPSILSFDVGIRHLAFCHISHEGWNEASCSIQQWDVIDLGPVPSVEVCASRLMTELDRRFKGLEVDLVLIERQPKARSIIMVAVQMFLCAYFSMAKLNKRVKEIKFISAQRKLNMKHVEPNMEVEGKTQYAANKKYAIHVTRHYLELLGDLGNLVLLDMYPKKDDLCDAFLQAVAYIEGGGRCGRLPFKRKTRKCNVI